MYTVAQNTLFSTNRLSKTFSLASITFSLQALMIIQRAFFVTSGFVTGFLVTLLSPNMQDGHPSAGMLHS